MAERDPGSRTRGGDPSGPDEPGVLKCSFCGKERRHVDHIISGPDGVAICDECVALATEIIAEQSWSPGTYG